MDLYECCDCGKSYYKKVNRCPYCDNKEFNKSNGTEEEVIITVLEEIELESGEYQQFAYDELEELVSKKLNKYFDYMSFSNALNEAVKKEYFSEITLYVSRA